VADRQLALLGEYADQLSGELAGSREEATTALGTLDAEPVGLRRRRREGHAVAVHLQRRPVLERDRRRPGRRRGAIEVVQEDPDLPAGDRPPAGGDVDGTGRG